MGTSGGLLGADVVQSLLAAPQYFDFCQAMELLEASDGEGLRFGEGLEKRIRLLPDENLVFPASDIRACDVQAQRLTLQMGFFGLYGVDAPVPHYLLDRTTASDDDASRMRDFLNIFNPRFYALLYRAMQISRPAAGRLPASFRGCASALSGRTEHAIAAEQAHKDRDADNTAVGEKTVNGAGGGAFQNRYFPLSRVRSAGGLQAVLQDRIPAIPVQVLDSLPAWQSLGSGCVLGGMGCALGDDAILGGRAYVANGAVAVRLGPVDSQTAQALLPGHPLGDELKQQTDQYLQGQTGVALNIRVCPTRRDGVGLGQDEQRLGWSVWLGERLQEEYVIRVALDATPSCHH